MSSIVFTAGGRVIQAGNPSSLVVVGDSIVYGDGDVVVCSASSSSSCSSSSSPVREEPELGEALEAGVSLVALLSQLGLHDRAKALLCYQSHAVALAPAQLVATIECLYLHDRAKTVRTLVEQAPDAFARWACSDWRQVLEAVYLHDRCKLLLDLLRLLPDGNFDNSLVDAVYLHDRGKLVGPLFTFVARRRQAGRPSERKDAKSPFSSSSSSSSSPSVSSAQRAGGDEAKEAEEDAEMKRAIEASLKESGGRASKATASGHVAAPGPDGGQRVGNTLPVANPASIKDVEPAENDGVACVVCLANRRNVVSAACMHAVLCLECLPTFTRSNCPVCQKALVSWLIVAL